MDRDREQRHQVEAKETQTESQRAGNVVCCACGRTCWVGWWVVWCHRSHTHSVSVVLHAASFMFTPLMGVTLRPRPTPFVGPFILKSQSVWGGKGGSLCKQQIRKWFQAATFRPGNPFFFHSPNPLMKCNKCRNAGGLIRRHFTTANFPLPQIPNSPLVFFPGLHLTVVCRPSNGVRQQASRTGLATVEMLRRQKIVSRRDTVLRVGVRPNAGFVEWLLRQLEINLQNFRRNLLAF